MFSFFFFLNFDHGHTGVEHENNNCSIISETVQAMPIKFVVKIDRLNVYNYDLCQSDDLETCKRSGGSDNREHVIACPLASRTARQKQLV